MVFCNVFQLEKLISEGTLQHDVVRFHYYVQYHLYMQVSIVGCCHSELLKELFSYIVFNCVYSPFQLSEAAAYARKKKVILKGDLPIGVDRNSVDTWVYPTLFRMNTATGAPPDYFDKNGQNWGFPTYNWEEMSKDNYGWWRARLTQVIQYISCCMSDWSYFPFIIHILLACCRWQSTSLHTGQTTSWVSLGYGSFQIMPQQVQLGNLDLRFLLVRSVSVYVEQTKIGERKPSELFIELVLEFQDELLSEGLWDFNRMSQPYIRQEILEVAVFKMMLMFSNSS